MKCRDFEKLLAEGGTLSEQAHIHLAECPGCRSLMAALDRLANPAEAAQTHHRPVSLPEKVGVVSPLPSDGVLIGLIFGFFLLFCLVVSALVGMAGYHAMSPLERLTYYGIVGVAGLSFCVMTVPAVIPGAKVRVRVGLMTVVSLLAVAATVSLLFRDFIVHSFVSRGIPCLRFGCVCAALFGMLASLLFRRGYITNVQTTSVLLGCFGGFSGVAVLSLHCPLQNALHIIVWHLGAVAVSALAGLLIGRVLQRKRA